LSCHGRINDIIDYPYLTPLGQHLLFHREAILYPRFSVLTPVRNRADLLERVGFGLGQQTFTSFEWLCGDDGSSDTTGKVARAVFENHSLSGSLISFDLHVGKSVVDNALLDCARGEFIVWCDSDDFFHKNALQSIDAIISHQDIAVDKVIVVTDVARIALYETFGREVYSYDPIDQYCPLVSILSGSERLPNDGMMVFHRSLFRSLRFPEVDFYTPEYSVFRFFQTCTFLYWPRPLKFGDYLSSGISRGNGGIRYSRGLWFAISLSLICDTSIADRHKLSTARLLVNFFRLGLHSSIPLSITCDVLKHSVVSGVSASVCFLFAAFVYLRDRVFKNVELTFTKFLKNTNRYRYLRSDFVKGTLAAEAFSYRESKSHLNPVEWLLKVRSAKSYKGSL
jgi:glycosyltransferase involved in cell wall biosynthesis